MRTAFNIHQYWRDVLRQDKNALRSYFQNDARINWHNTNEQFTVEEFIKANCTYPGSWDGEVEKVLYADSEIVTVVHVYSIDHKLSFHVTSFIRISNDKISAVDEYWGDDGAAPKWRQDLGIGSIIK